MSNESESLGADNAAFQPDEAGDSKGAPPQDAAGDSRKAEPSADAVAAAAPQERQQWSNGIEFLLSCVAMSVGLGNVWRFPFTAYENGGGAFLIPYIIVLIIIGRPLYYLEMGLGQFTSRGCVKVWNVSPALRGIGYGQIIATASVLSYYMSLMAITIFYLIMSFSAELPWGKCRPEWEEPCTPATPDPDAPDTGVKGRSSAELYFLNYVLKEKDSLEDGIGVPDWRLTLCLLGAWLMVLGLVIRGVQSSGKAAYFLALFPYVVLVTLLVRGCTLPGAGDGILYFVEPKWEELGNAKVWYAAVTQAFFSLNVGFGTLINYSSYNAFRHNIYRDAMIVTTLDTFTSLLAGCTIFSILGNLKYETGEESFDAVVQSGAGLAFISYPNAIAKFDAVPQLFAVLFFLMLLSLGLGSALALITAISTIITDNIPSFKQWMVLCAVTIAGFLIGLVYVTPAGQWILTLVDHFGGTYPVLALMCVQMAAVAWLYGLDNICNDLKFMLNREPGSYWRITWGIITPIFLIVVLIYAAVEDERLLYGDREFPDHYYPVGWTILGVAAGMCPLFALYEIITRLTKMSFTQAVVSAFQPADEWGPSDPQTNEEWQRETESFRRQRKAAREGCVRRGVREFCGCGRLPVLAPDEEDGGATKESAP